MTLLCVCGVKLLLFFQKNLALSAAQYCAHFYWQGFILFLRIQRLFDCKTATKSFMGKIHTRENSVYQS